LSGLWATRILIAIVAFLGALLIGRLVVVYMGGGGQALLSYIRAEKVTTIDSSLGTTRFILDVARHPYLEFATIVFTLIIVSVVLFLAHRKLKQKLSQH